MTGKPGTRQRSPSTLAARREWKCQRNHFAECSERSIQAHTPSDATVLSNDSQEAPTNQRHLRHESVTHDGNADAFPGRVWIFEAYSDVQSIRPKKRSSCRD